jgi:RNA polymerase sigma factor (sigma-70 family)
VQDNTLFQDCLGLVARLDAERGWELSQREQQQYARQVAEVCAGQADRDETDLCVVIGYYHSEHRLVEALRDTEHPEHAFMWSEWIRHASRILASKVAGVQPANHTVVGLEDLAQEAMHDLWRGLPAFRYQCRFQTWAFTVISNCLARHYRTLQTQKRGPLQQTQSLDAMLAVADTFVDLSSPSPDEEVLSTMLALLLRQVLEQHPDRRLAIIFHIWVSEERPLRAIGDELHLSAARVHGLLNQALVLLRNQPVVQEWVEKTLPMQL